MKSLNYYFRFLFKNTKYMMICICMLIMSMSFVISFISDPTEINSSFFPFSEITPFFLNPTNRIFFVIFILVMPLIVSIPVADIIKLESSCQYHILTRNNKKMNIISKTIVCFFCGFSLYFIVLMSNVIFSNVIFNQGNQDYFNYLYFFVPNNHHITLLTIPFYDLFLSNPMILSIIHVFCLSILGGFISLMTLSIGSHFKSLLITYCFSFVVLFCLNTFMFVIPGIIDVFNPLYSTGSNFTYIIGYFVFLFLVNLIGLACFVKKDVY